MDRMLDRIEFGSAGAIIKRVGERVDEVVAQLEWSKSPFDTSVSLDLEGLDLTAALAIFALGDDSSDGIPLIRSSPKRPRLRDALKSASWRPLFPRAGAASLLSLTAGLGQILDFWDISHNAAQEADDLREGKFANFWHAIIHRREPDYSNASYWFRIVGNHPVFPTLREDAQALLDREGETDLMNTLAPNGQWDPFAFLDYCRVTSSRPAGREETLARKIQRLEMIDLLEATANSISEIGEKE